jgi:RimJ/RimL family protein N-acetyltransferase
MKIGPVDLEGTHVRLESMRASHADGLVAAGTGHGLFRFFPYWMETEPAMRAYVKSCIAALEAGTMLPFVTIERASGRVVGSTCYLAIEPAHKRLEIGSTWITPAQQRSPVNTEAKLLQLGHCFETLGCNRVEFKTDSRNAQSRAALARIGAKEEGVFRAHMVMPDGVLRDSVYFSVVAPEWPDVKARLLQKIARSESSRMPG